MRCAVGQLRAVYDDGKTHSEGKVKGMWSSGIVLETDVHPSIGSAVALVVLSGGFDGDRLAAQVAGFENNALLLDLPGLDPVRWARLQALVDGKPLTMPLPAGAPARQPPPNAPVFIISGGEDADGAPTGVFDRADVTPLKSSSSTTSSASPPGAQSATAKANAPLGGFSVPSPLDPFPFAAAPPPPDPWAGQPKSAAATLAAANRRVGDTALAEENSKLKAELVRVNGLKAALEGELKDALAKLQAIERSLKR